MVNYKAKSKTYPGITSINNVTLLNAGMKIIIRQKLFLCAFIILMCNAVSVFFVYKSDQRLRDSEYWVQHTEQVIYQSANVRSMGQDIETASRGYVITCDTAFLEPLYSAKKTTFVYIRHLKQLTRDNYAQQQRIDSLDHYMHQLLDFSFKTVELRNKQGLASAIAFTATKLGKGYTDHIRRITFAIQQQEDSLLKVRKQTNAQNTAAFNQFSVGMFILLGIFTIFLLIIIRKYLLQKKEKAERAGELVIANKNLLFQNNEKEKRAVELAVVGAELAIAQEEIFYQSNEKGERAGELLIANEELFFQNGEKEKRAAELVIANKELSFQNKEKEKRAAELIIANKELLFQNEEKEKRAEELIIANEALLFQNNEKEKRAAELTIANKELSFQNKEKEKRAAELKLAEIARIKIVNELMTRNRDLEQFAYIISHNLRAPVANIIGASSALNDIQLSAEDKDVLSRGINVSVRKLDEVVNDLNHILQVKGEINGIKEIVHFSGLVDDIKISINNLIDKEAIEIKYDFTRINEFLTLKPYLYSIFFNLISNSVKYRRPEIHSVIKISSRLQKRKLELIFSDNGMGINLKKSGSQVFDLYKRFHTNIEGKGMGLFMVKTQVETLGGKINIESTENEGTEFIIEFEI